MQRGKPGKQLLLFFSRPAACIDEQHHQTDLAPGEKVSLHQSFPTGSHRLRNLGVPVAREIYQRQAIIDHEKMDLLGPAGRLAHARQPVALGCCKSFSIPRTVLTKVSRPALSRTDRGNGNATFSRAVVV